MKTKMIGALALLPLLLLAGCGNASTSASTSNAATLAATCKRMAQQSAEVAVSLVAQEPKMHTEAQRAAAARQALDLVNERVAFELCAAGK